MIKEEIVRQRRSDRDNRAQTFEFEPKEISTLFQTTGQKFLNHSVDDEMKGLTVMGSKTPEGVFSTHEITNLDTQIGKGLVLPNSTPEQEKSELNSNMFEALIRTLASKKQYSQYLQTLLSEDVEGFYAGTELGHGSDIYSIQTEAILDPVYKSLTINTPSLPAIKL